jgi:uncharacterized membrane protein
MPLGMKLLLVLWSPLAMVPLALVLSRVPLPQPLPYAWHKALHILGAVMFVGNMLTQALWLSAARLSGSAAAIRAGFRALNWTDLVFMGPGMFLLLANGAVLSQAWGGIERWSWMVVALGLFGLYGAASGPLMWIQMRSFRVLRTAPDERLAAELDAVNQGKGLGVWMLFMLAVPVVILVIMVVKPRFW